MKKYKLLIIIILVIVVFAAGFAFVKYSELYKKNSGKTDSNKIIPKDYSLVGYSLKSSPIYSELPDYCSDPKQEPWTIQKDVQLVKNGNEIIVPSLLQLIFASDNEKPNCITEISIFSAPKNGKYLYLEVPELSFKEHLNRPIYRLDLSNLSVKKLSNVSIGGSNTVEEDGKFFGFIIANNVLLPDGKRLIQWDENGVYLVDMKTDYKNILYTAPQNQWLISSIDPEDAVGQIFNTDVKIEGNQIVIGIYDKNISQDGKVVFDNDGDINWKELDPSGEHMIEPKFKFIEKVTISIPKN
ncbi:MAG: hypothetical protein L6Q29_01665 [Candidatus Pacebacteria bacterium]|nr:hypothetical protein [Candidatus Paceibacterota bacterium]NUQ57321.1 hypothetical protein [Candidatus Paceibacter sp.]